MVGEEGDLAWEQNKVNIKKQQQVCENTQHKHTYKYINIKQMEYFFFHLNKICKLEMRELWNESKNIRRDARFLKNLQDEEKIMFVYLIFFLIFNIICTIFGLFRRILFLF